MKKEFQNKKNIICFKTEGNRIMEFQYNKL